MFSNSTIKNLLPTFRARNLNSWRKSVHGLLELIFNQNALYFYNGMVSIDAGPIDAGIIDADSLMPKLLRPVTIDAGHY